MPRRKKKPQTSGSQNVHIRAIRRDPPDIEGLAKALIQPAEDEQREKMKKQK